MAVESQGQKIEGILAAVEVALNHPEPDEALNPLLDLQKPSQITCSRDQGSS
jgi:hypothetical protein